MKTLVEGEAEGEIICLETPLSFWGGFDPVSGKVTKINAALESQPELVNEDCYGKGWMLVIAPSNAADKDQLLSPGAYGDLLKSAGYEPDAKWVIQLAG